jgi:NitT/TauT family transport system substrate-binding protein
MKLSGITTILALAALIAIPLTAAPLAAAPLRIGVLPDADSLPLLVADAEGLFAAEGVDVKLLPFKTAVERDAALQAGAIDGAVTDLLAVALANQGGFDIKATSLTDGRYGILVAPQSQIRTLSGLAGKSIGISSNTIIQYAAETMLVRAGVVRSDIKAMAVPKIQLRMELLLAGQLDAACLPEPLLSVAKAKGAVLLASSDDAGLGAGVLAFSRAAINGRLADLAAFYRAYWKAGSEINAKSDSYRPFLVDKAGFPAEVRDSFAFITYKKPRLPSDVDLAAVIAWMKAKGLLTKDIVPSSLVDGSACPQN